MQATIDPLHVIHDYVFSRSQVAPVDPNHAASLPPIEQKLVRENPRNGLKNYYVGSHARSIVGWSGIESRKLIDELTEQATRPQDVYAHQWQVGDTVIWDNRCLLHRGGGYDADRWRRRMRQTRSPAWHRPWRSDRRIANPEADLESYALDARADGVRVDGMIPGPPSFGNRIACRILYGATGAGSVAPQALLTHLDVPFELS